MCSIHGLYRPDGADIDGATTEFLLSLIAAGRDRGRDSWGVRSSSGQEVRLVEDPANAPWSGFTLQSGDRWAVSNCRAEPTTEWVREKAITDVQPFTSHGITVAHNGIIANDVELADRWNLERETAIDSAVLPGLLASVDWTSRLGPGEYVTARDLDWVLTEEIVGSYALAAGRDDRLLLACNYKPLALRRDPETGIIWFTSLEEYGRSGESLEERLESPWVRMDPYSAVLLTPEGIEEFRLSHANAENRALVVCSGGLDSVVAATLAAQSGPVTLLHFTYGCRAEDREVQAIQDVAARMGWDVEMVDVRDLFTEVIGHSRLTGTLQEETAGGVEGAEFAHEWVPARNLILLSVAVGIAEGRQIGRVILGNNLEESGAYPDNEMAFVDRLNEVLPYAVAADRTVRVEMPVGNMMKHEIIRLGLDAGAPLDITWSCYDGGVDHCGDCGPCFMRRTAFQMNSVPDPVSYLA